MSEKILLVTQERNDSIWIVDKSIKDWLRNFSHNFDFLEIYPCKKNFLIRILNHIKNISLILKKSFKYKYIYFTYSNPYSIFIKLFYKNKKITMCFHHLEPIWKTSLLCKFILKTTDYFIAISKFTKKQLIDLWVNENNIFVNYNWISDWYYPEVIKNFTNYKYILYVWTEVERKNTNYLLEVFSDIYKLHPEIKLVKIWVIWTKEEWERFDKKVKSLSLEKWVVIIRNYLDESELRKRYSNAICLVSLSKLEWFWLTIPEAMACWCPVIVSNIPPFKEICEDNQILVDLNDRSWIVKSIEKFISDENHRKIYYEKGIELSKKFNWITNCEQLIKYFNMKIYNE